MEKIENENQNNLFRIFKGSIASLIITAIFLFIASIFFTYININDNMIPAVILVITTISVFTGSIIASKNIKKNGLINGAALGIIYILILYLVSSIFITGFSLNIKSLIMLALSIGAGIIGGIVGVNL